MPFRGFTIIELMVAITILAIISSVGFISYSSAQAGARDAKRKQDLKAIQTALNLYYQVNKNSDVSGITPYPGTNMSTHLWRTSNLTNPWIVKLNSDYIDNMPKDPLRNDIKNTLQDDPLQTGVYGYAYISDDGTNTSIQCSGLKPGHWYILIAHLENKYDPEANGTKEYKCPNNPAVDIGGATPWPPEIYMVTSP